MLKYKPFIAERKERKSLISDKKNLSFFHEKLSQEESSFFSIAKTLLLRDGENCWGQFHQHVYAKLLHAQIQKDSQVIIVFLQF